MEYRLIKYTRLCLHRRSTSMHIPVFFSRLRITLFITSSKRKLYTLPNIINIIAIHLYKKYTLRDILFHS